MRPIILLLLPLTLPACGDLSFTSAKDAGGDSGWYEGDADPSPDADDSGGAGWDSDDYGHETEDSFIMLRPAATNRYVFVANPDRDTVTRIDVDTLGVITTEVGVKPKVVETTADYSRAICFNEGSDTLSVIDAESLEVQDVEVRPNLNAMVVSPAGRWTVVYHDAEVTDGDTTDDGGARSYNEVSVVDTDNLVDYPLVVGLNPRQVVFTDDGELAIVVSDESLTLLDLTGDEPDSTFVDISFGELDPPQAEEVAISPAGGFAFVRQYGADAIVTVDLVTDEVGSIPVGINPTDLDLTPDGLRAVVVARGSSQIYLLDATDPEAAPTVVDMPTEELLGSVLLTPDGSKGILYTTADLRDHYAVWDTTTNEITVRSLVKPIESVTISPSGTTLVVVHTREDAPDADTTSMYYHSYALTMLSLVDFRSNPSTLDYPILSFAHSDDGDWGFFVTESDPTLYRLAYEDLIPDPIDLRSAPEYLGMLPDTHTAYVSQEHELGRISFYDADADTLQTITGFELNSEIEHD